MKIQTRLSAEPRKNLGRALPLEQPYVLLVDPSSLCNLRCKWCPSGYDQLIAETGRSQQVMDLALFERLVDQAAAWGKPFRVLRMYKEGEPLVNPFFADMVRLAKQSGWFLRIDTTTNGVLLNPKLNRKLIEAGIDQINISVNGMSAEQIYRNTGNHVDFGAYVQNIQDLCGRKGDCTIYIKSIKSGIPFIGVSREMSEIPVYAGVENGQVQWFSFDRFAEYEWANIAMIDPRELEYNPTHFYIQLEKILPIRAVSVKRLEIDTPEDLQYAERMVFTHPEDYELGGNYL